MRHRLPRKTALSAKHLRGGAVFRASWHIACIPSAASHRGGSVKVRSGSRLCPWVAATTSLLADRDISPPSCLGYRDPGHSGAVAPSPRPPLPAESVAQVCRRRAAGAASSSDDHVVSWKRGELRPGRGPRRSGRISGDCRARKRALAFGSAPRISWPRPSLSSSEPERAQSPRLGASAV